MAVGNDFRSPLLPTPFQSTGHVHYVNEERPSEQKKRNRDRRMEESDKMSIDLVDDGEDETYSRPKSSIWDGC